MVLLRFAWIFGLLHSREYDRRLRVRKTGAKTEDAPDSAVQRLEKLLVEERAAVVLFLAGGVVLAYSLLNGPAFR
jgi:hypothetical protein